MAYGLQMWDNSGNEILNISDSLTKFITTFNVSSSGSTTIAALSGQRVWYTSYCISTNPSNYVAPIVTISGTTVSWSYWSSFQNCTSMIFIGVY